MSITVTVEGYFFSSKSQVRIEMYILSLISGCMYALHRAYDIVSISICALTCNWL